MKKLDLIITTTDEGVFVTKTERTDGELSGRGYINRRYDSISIEIQTLEESRR